MGKKQFLNLVLKKFRNFLTNKTHVLFVAPVPHHVIHLELVVESLAKDHRFVVSTIGPFKIRDNVYHFNNANELSLTASFDIAIATDFGLIPRQLHTLKAFFGHGIGPKINYQARASMDEFNYSLCACDPIYQSHLAAGLTSLKIGLPILDTKPKVAKDQLVTIFGIDPSLPILVYAPSWCGNTEMISDIELILSGLVTLRGTVNVIVSPHPNLFSPERCSGKSFFAQANLPINKSQSGLSTFDLCANADYVVSDISSVLFESMAIGKRTFFDGNEAIYHFSEATHVLDVLKQNIATIDWKSSIIEQLNMPVVDCSEFINQYVFNNGRATSAFIEAIPQMAAHQERSN